MVYSPTEAEFNFTALFCWKQEVVAGPSCANSAAGQQNEIGAAETEWLCCDPLALGVQPKVQSYR